LVASSIVLPVVPSLGQSSGQWLGRERGPFPTGTFAEVWVDDDRGEMFTDAPGDKRRLTIQIWYPASSGGSGRVAPYALAFDSYDRETRESWEAAATRTTGSLLEAQVSDAQSRYPVILYSHGSQMPSFSGTAQTEFLASHGYVVVSIGHTGWDGRSRFPDNYRYDAALPDDPDLNTDGLTPIQLYRRGGQRPSLQTRYATGLQDVKFVIDRLHHLDETSESRLHQRLDLSRIGGFGFSLGGSILFEATLSEPRIAATANLDGGLNGLKVLNEGARKPVLLIEASERFPAVVNGPADAGMEEFFVEVERETWQMLRLSTGEWSKAQVLGAIHPHFSDTFLIVPAPEELIEPLQAHALVNALLLEFFNRHLRGDEATPILNHEKAFDRLRLVTKSSEQRLKLR
jgi:dienelactone hydrolase